MSKFCHCIMTVLVLTLGITLSVVGTRLIIAGIAGYQADVFIQTWEKNNSEPQPDVWNAVHAAAQRAIDLYPVANGDYLDRLGRIQSWKYFRQPYAEATARYSRLAALDAYRASVIARPTWPYTWARLAHTKVYLQEFDNEFDNALATAFELGSWRVGVNRELAEIGFLAWSKLDEKQRLASLESARRTVANGPREAKRLLQIAEHSHRRQTLCDSLDTALKTARKICL
ncbi:hypothetical protein PS900_04195 [Pseudomonas fluorescens]|uniref:Uncharacterized protein n=1 Tax=Pseudomonas fluorescens TaxID=294 RepID=A0A8H2NWD8_PSEFL|nr:hypothetical protein [Pseudomonas fluorescens]VVP27788.1 hypothetical protein PS900_04195 [Pseudomonas fluorescens]